MARGNDLKLFNLNSASEAIFKNCKIRETRKSFIFKRKREVCVAIFLLAALLVILLAFKPKNFPQVQKAKKIKRYLKTNEFDQDIINKTDIEIVSENRRLNQYPNHKYVENDLPYEEKMKPQMNSNKVFQPVKPKTNRKIQKAVFRYDKLIGKKSKQQKKLPNKLLEDLTSSMRLKGIYVQTESGEGALRNKLNEKHYYPKEINNLMQNVSDDEGEGRKWSLRKTFKSHGIPFQLPQGRESVQLQKLRQDDFQINRFSKKRPLTIYLDFYSMREPENLKKKLKPNSPLRTKFHNPKPSHSIKVGTFFLAKDKRNRMIMKLNLYPKESMALKRDFRRRGENLQIQCNNKCT